MNVSMPLPLSVTPPSHEQAPRRPIDGECQPSLAGNGPRFVGRMSLVRDERHNRMDKNNDHSRKHS